MEWDLPKASEVGSQRGLGGLGRSWVHSGWGHPGTRATQPTGTPALSTVQHGRASWAQPLGKPHLASCPPRLGSERDPSLARAQELETPMLALGDGPGIIIVWTQGLSLQHTTFPHVAPRDVCASGCL